MSTLFEGILEGKIPGKFVWADDSCFAIATIQPVQSGHVLVIPKEPYENWTDLPPQLLDHLMRVSQIIAKAQKEAFGVERSGVIIAGFEVPHVHVHVIPARSEADCSLHNAKDATPEELLAAMHSLRDILRNSGYEHRVPLEIDSANVG